MKFYTSDQHFDHANIIKFCKRPWATVEEMNDALVTKWNRRVSHSDDVYVLGDICFNKNRFIHFMKYLNGTKHIILGNHDPKNIQHELRGMKNVVLHDKVHVIKDNGRKIHLQHEPCFEWTGYWNGVVHFHGHTHGTIGKNYQRNAFDVGVDCRDYEPKTYDEIVGNDFVKFTIADGHTLIPRPDDMVVVDGKLEKK